MIPEGALPPILEVEDHPIVFSGPHTPSPENFNPPSALAEIYNRRDQEENRDPPRLGVDRPLPKIDDHTPFWSTYDKVSGAYDREFLDAWNKSLDVLLIFAGLFSAINTAFIVESYKGLQQDPIEITNALLRLFISHRNDNVTLSIEDLNPGPPPSSVIAINTTFFSSLSFSLTAAFGAVTAKQWLTGYNNIGAVKVMHIQGRRRQEKYNGLKAWHLRLIIEFLPMLLQISLLLFLIGVVHFLWNLDRQVAATQLVLSGMGLAVYFVTIVIGIVFPSSPFRTPFSIYLSRYFNKATQGSKALIVSLVPSRIIESMMVAARKIRWINGMAVAFSKINIIGTWQSLRILVRQGLLGLGGRIGYATVVGAASPEIEDLDNNGWSTEDLTAAEAVVWLLEQAEHPDVTITALDAVTRLPPDLMLNLVQNHDGLLERLVKFHKGLLPPLPGGEVNRDWIQSWPDKAIVSGLALWHILKVKGFIHNDIKGEYIVRTFHNGVMFDRCGDPITAAKYYLTWSHLMFFNWMGNHGSSSYYMFEARFDFSLSTNPFQFFTEITDQRQASTGISFTASVNPFALHLDAMIHFACKSQYTDNSTLKHIISYRIERLSSALQGEQSPEAVSLVAITAAALHVHFRGNDVWSYPLATDQRRLERTLITRFHVLNKNEMLLENVTLALSAIDISELDSTIFKTLFSLVYPSFISAFEHHPIKIYPNLPQSLIRLSRRHIDDTVTQLQICEVLGRCMDGEWVSPLHKDYGGDIVRLIGTLLHSNVTEDTTSHLLDMMARVSDDTQLLHILESNLDQFHTAICQTMIRSDHPPIISPDDQDRLVNNPSPLNHIAPRAYADCLQQIYSPDESKKYRAYALTCESILLLWKKSKQYHVNGRLPPVWNDAMFFQYIAMDVVLFLFQTVQRQKYSGVESDSWKEYFKRALQVLEDTGLQLIDDEGQKQEIWGRINTVLDELEGHSQV